MRPAAVVAALCLGEQSCVQHQSAFPPTYDHETNVTCGVTDGRRGLYASREFRVGEVVAHVPEHLHLWEPTIPAAIRQNAADCPPGAYANAVLAAGVLEARRDPDARFRGFITALVQITAPSINNLPVFSADHRTMVNVTRPDLIGSQQQTVECVRNISAQVPRLKDQAPALGEILWSLAIVNSRAMRSTVGRWALVPVLDLVNHDFEPNVEVRTADSGHGAMYLQATRQIQGGEELLRSYGDLSNTELLALYGFSVPSNPRGMVMPYDFNLIQPEDKGVPSDVSCTPVLRWPMLVSDAVAGYTSEMVSCLYARLSRYYLDHPGEMLPFDADNLQLKTFESLVGLCKAKHQQLSQLHDVINRLRQHGQKIGDLVSVALADSAVGDLRILQACMDAYQRAVDAQEKEEL
mmetsp:Transcript_36277/g.79207  ORF Transcript_36277/g.79207 Transcript_36277/m.79207 type:complete len:408 (-) Transcript_36277:44-1267(-)|eukprot:CAMPEP_0204316672 /NCGR_PEP_ID=MMETSP0469-20131031/5526_1 /ASSEMBLY_ACC=CAM_ASM_000384 /TAXON_ID=2969 /ORGANISM="Oxyrrhis marina" /LENGTH=407 /DNA_ID=CAMNT_0051297473 /DNA_START=46 /DNA_END=1269 /DNA_ORIENTATION=+